MESLQQKPQSRQSLNRCITVLADEAAQMRRERDEARRERDTFRELLSVSLDATRHLQQRLDRTQDSLRRLLETIRSARDEQARVAA